MRFCCVILGLGAITGWGFAQEPTYTIKLKLDADLGQTLRVQSQSEDRGYLKFFDQDGKLQDEEKPEKERTELRTTVLEKDKNGKITKSLRSYVTAQTTKEEKTKSRSYEGATLLFDHTGSVFQLGVIGTAKLTAEDTNKLAQQAGRKSDWRMILEHLAPKDAVRVGTSWKIDPKVALKEAKDFTPIPEKSTITAKLAKVTTKGKTTFAVIEIDASIAVSGAFGVVKFEPPAKLSFKGSTEAAIDGSTTERVDRYTENVIGKGKVDSPGRQGTMELDATSEYRTEYSAAKDDPLAKQVPKVTWLTGPNAWSEFASKEHKFKAMFPGKPSSTTEKDQRGFPTTQFAVSADNGDTAYIVAITEFPDEFPVDPVTVLKALEDNAKVKDEDKKVIRLNGFPGREFILRRDTKDRKIVITQRVYVVKNRLYQALYVESERSKGDPKKFFDSFSFDDKQKGKDD